MKSKIDTLIDKLKLSEDCKNNLVNSKLDKIIANREKTKYCFVITIDNILLPKFFDEFKDKLKKEFSSIDEVDVNFNVKNINYDYLELYFKKALEFYSKKSSMLKMFLESKIDYKNNLINIHVSTVNEVKKINDFKDKLISFLDKVGYDDIVIDTTIDKEEELKIREEIENSKVTIETVKEENHTEVLLGRKIDTDISKIKDVSGIVPQITFEAKVFGIDVRETRSGYTIFTIKITDNTDSMYAKMFARDSEEASKINKILKVGKWYKLRGPIKEDKYTNEDTFNITDINESDVVESKIVDDAEVKRVELHAHTIMSQMDGLTRVDLGKHTCELVSRCIDMGYRGVAITDHNGCQAFPIAYNLIRSHNKGIEDPKDHFKGLYGTELTLVDDSVDIVIRPTEDNLIDTTYVVFDTETTGFNAGGADQMIEIGAVKLHNGAIVDRFDELIDPKRPIPKKISELTNITDDMVKGKPSEEEVTKSFLEFVGDLPLVAHNAKFDINFLSMAMKKYNLGELNNTIIDTLELSRTLDQGFARHGLSALVKRYNVPWAEDAHHRADYDAEGTALVFAKMLEKLKMQNYKTIADMDKLVSKDEIHKFGRTYHFNAIAKNQAGLKNLFKVISLANTVYLYKTPRIPRSKLEELREGLLIGSGCYESEVFNEARNKEGEELTNIINFYDYVEVQPPDVYDHLIQTSDFKDYSELESHIKKIIDATKEAGKIIVATGDVHHFTKEDKIYRKIIVNQKVPGGGRHPLAKSNITEIPSQHFRTTNEMLDNFSFLDKDLAYEIVVENTNKVLDMVDELEVIVDTKGIPFSPRVKGEDGEYLDCPRVVTDLVYEKAKSWYNDPLPHNIEERIAKELYGDVVYNTCKANILEKEPNIGEEELENRIFADIHEVILKGIDAVKELVKENIKKTSEEELSDDELNKRVKKELGGIIGGGFDSIYLIAQRLVKHSNDEGFLVGSRGSVGSSFVATMMGITEVNPLPAHYRCTNCKTSIFDDENGDSLGATYSSGFDLPDKKCPNCGELMYKDGQDMPFATFLGFNADKVPDIDLNFSDLNQASAHEYTKVLFGVDNVYRAGTIGTVAEKTAYGFVKGYCEDNNIFMRPAEIERLAMGCTGVKRTTGQHPGGIVVVPDYKDVSDFTPFQYPADDPTSAWRTTHFDYHSIEEDLLKLDILGHSDPTQLRMIQEFTGTDVSKVPLDDKDTMGIFSSTKPLGVTKEQIMNDTGTLGIPEFGTNFTVGMVNEIKPTTFAELIKIAGLSHGTDVWLGNAQELIKNKIVPFKEVIGCRDDIMVYLMYHGVEPIKAFKIMEFVRKGRASKDPETWASHKKTMEDAGIESWFIDSCGKIKYMFPKAHAAAYVISAFRIAWYKVHMPAYFYATWLTSKATDVDVETMIKGYDAIKRKIIEIQSKGFEATNKELGQLESLKVCLEATARGINFLPVDLHESEATIFTVKDDNNVRPPFSAIDGLGDVVAKKIVEEREKRDFLSVEEVQYRAKVSSTLIDKMKLMGIFDGMSESNQLSLFD